MRVVLVLCMFVPVLAGCAALPGEATAPVATPAETPVAAPPDATLPAARPAAVRPPPAGARTARAFDTTSAAERSAALAAAAPVTAATLRTTVALGDPASPGLWLETPLVTVPGKASVRIPATGKAAELDLRPIPGPSTAGSRMSLAAMRLLDLPLTALTEVEVALP